MTRGVSLAAGSLVANACRREMGGDLKDVITCPTEFSISARADHLADYMPYCYNSHCYINRTLLMFAQRG